MSTVIFSAGRRITLDRNVTSELKKLVKKPKEKVIRLSFGKNAVLGVQDEQLFCEYLENNQTLEDLNLGPQSTLMSFLPDMVKAILNNRKTRLKRIDFSSCVVGNDAIQYIALLLKGNTSLQELNLNNGSFGEEAMHHLTDVILQSNLFIEEIWTFGNSNLRTADMRIFEAIARNKDNNKGKRMFASELDNNEMVRWGRSKLMVIGQGGAGKTSTVRSLLGKAFVKEHDSTIGASLTKTDTSAWQENKAKESDFNETASRAVRKMRAKVDEKREKEREEFLANKQLKFELENTLLEVEKLSPNRLDSAEEKKEKKEGSSGNAKKKEKKTDELEIDREPISGENFEAKIAGKLLHETDVARRFKDRLISKAIQHGDEEDDENKLTFTIWDYGGQTVFYTLHHLFLTKYGVYLIVFDMSKFLGKYDDAHAEAVQFLRFWIRSVMLHAPNAPAILVGTHLDTVVKRVKASGVEEFYEKVNTSLEHDVNVTKHKPLVKNGSSLFFPLDNSKGLGVEELRKQIDDAARDKHYVKQEIPLRWVLTLDLLINEEEMEKASSRTWVSLKEVETTGERFGVGKLEAAEMLKLFNQLGVLIYLNATTALRDVIITDPQWLIKKLGKIIRDDMHGAPRELTNELIDDWAKLRDRAIAGKDLLEAVWKDSQLTNQMVRQFPFGTRKEVILRKYNETQANFLIDLMQNTMLMSEWFWERSKQKEAFFLIPSLLQNRKDVLQQLNAKLANWKHETDATLFLDFSEFFLPTGIFQRIVCLLVAIIGHQGEIGTEPILGKDFAFLEFAGKANKVMTSDLFLRVHGDARIMVNIENGASSADMLLVMTSLVRRMREQVTGSRLKVSIIITNRLKPVDPAPRERSSLRKTNGDKKSVVKKKKGSNAVEILPTGPLVNPENFEEMEQKAARNDKAYSSWFSGKQKGKGGFRIEEFLS